MLDADAYFTPSRYFFADAALMPAMIRADFASPPITSMPPDADFRLSPLYVFDADAFQTYLIC